MEFIVKSKSNADFKKIIKLLPSKHREGYQYILEATIFYEKSRLLIAHNEADKAQIYSNYFCDIDIIEPPQQQENECNPNNNTLSFKAPSTLLDSICQYIEEYDLHFEITSNLLKLNFIDKPLPAMTKSKDTPQMDFDFNEVELDEQVKLDIPISFEIGISSFSFKESAKNTTSSFHLSAPVLNRHFENAASIPSSSKKAKDPDTIFNVDMVTLQYCRVTEHESRLILYTNNCYDISISSFKCTPALLPHNSFFILVAKSSIKKLASLFKDIEKIEVSLQHLPLQQSSANSVQDRYYLTLSAGSISFSVNVKPIKNFRDSTETLKEITKGYQHNTQVFDAHKWNEFSVGNELYKSNAHAIQLNYRSLKKEPENNIDIKCIYQEDLSNQASSTLNYSISAKMPFKSNCNFKLNLSLFNHAIKTLSEYESNDSPVKMSSNESNYDGILLTSEIKNTFNERFFFLVPFES
ncbi:hypothetical protein E2R68_08455 [Psychromonas sp. RZ22]|uniref:hypothetical protein n=1 Tax=Psychromonas algarum TaxID=2555643 RepID=UPI001068554E|nr:hypothetical protein [Psychromonas sp. RZ22]TEW54719.1 hypothetical protein E2R68_08455 [Psychromonas sp. RZ22]